MPTLAQLGHVLTACRVTTPEQWERATELGAGVLTRILDALANDTAEWSAGAAEAPGLTDYQRGVIELWFEEGGPPPHRQLALNRFLLLDKLGQGGQGAVYRARQLNPARFVAVKALTQDTDAGRERFEQEAKAMMRVQHPGVARFYLYERVRDLAGTPTNEYLIAMEYVEGTDLHRLGQWLGPVPWPFVLRWAVDLLGGLTVIHKNGFIHRDIKPANVMILGPAPEPGVAPSTTAAKLLDFGAVKPTADGLGATLFHALTGRPPYEVKDRDVVAFIKAHSRAPIPSARELNPDVAEPLDRLLRRMLAKDPADRGTATELLDEFRALLPADARTDTSRTAAAPPPPPRAPKPAGRPRTAPPVEEEKDEGAGRGVVGSVLVALERVFLPVGLRPPAGHEPPATERVAALLRRPLVLVTILILLALLIFLLVGR
jgi:hypothetical protein